MIQKLTAIFAPLAILACVAAPVTLAVREQRQAKNLHVVREGVLYRSAQLSPAGLKRVVHDRRIRTVINLREGSAGVDLAEEKFCAEQEIRFVRLLPKSWDGGAGKAEVDENVRAFLEVMQNPANYPVLVHCFAGIHRTGAYCAVYRMECEGWDNARAISEVKAMGYDNFENELDIKGWLEGYRPGRLGAPLDRSRTTPDADALSAAKERGRQLAKEIKPGTSWELCREMIGETSLDMFQTGGSLSVLYGKLHISVGVSLDDGKVTSVKYHEEWKP